MAYFSTIRTGLYKEHIIKSDILLNIRATKDQLELINTAADLLYKSRTDFILEVACQAAENVIMAHQVFTLNDEQYAEFIHILDAPVSVTPALNALLARKPRWDN